MEQEILKKVKEVVIEAEPDAESDSSNLTVFKVE